MWKVEGKWIYGKSVGEECEQVVMILIPKKLSKVTKNVTKYISM